jgi:hypothetical protein
LDQHALVDGHRLILPRFSSKSIMIPRTINSYRLWHNKKAPPIPFLRVPLKMVFFIAARFSEEDLETYAFDAILSKGWDGHGSRNHFLPMMGLPWVTR